MEEFEEISGKQNKKTKKKRGSKYERKVKCCKGKNAKINYKKTSLKLKDMNSDIGEIPITIHGKGLMSRHVVMKFFIC